MGAVYAGTNEITGEQAAVKMLSIAFASETHFRDRFETEIETLKKLQHPNIVQLLAWGEHEGHLYYAMDLVEGKSLFEELRSGRRFTPREVIHIGRGVCAGLRHAHDRGIVHRDIKPANLMLTTENAVKITDFGIAKFFGGQSLTSDGGVIGTADYMAPEQAKGVSVTARSDLYSVGSVLYALLCGKPPFASNSLPKVLHSLQFDPAPSLREAAPQTPSSLAKLIHRLLEKDPSARIATALAVSRRLDEIEAELPPDKPPSTDAAASKNATPKPDNDDVAAAGDQAEDDDDLFEEVENPVDNATIARRSTYSRPTAPVPPDPAIPANDTSVEKPVSSTTPPAESSKQSAPTAIHASVAGRDIRRDDTPIAWQPYPPGAESVLADDATRASMSDQKKMQAPAEPQPDRYMTLEEEEQQRETEKSPESNLPAILSAVSIALLLLLLAGMFVYASLPDTANSLYGKIQAEASKSSGRKITLVKSEVDDFLERFPEDPRVEEVRRLQQEIEMKIMENRLNFSSASGRASTLKSPVEQAYYEAITLAGSDPSAGAARLRALIQVYDDPGASETVKVRLDLARKQLVRLEAVSEQSQKSQLQAIKKRLATAHELRETDAAKSLQIYQGIVELYGSKPWAAGVVAEARHGMSQVPEPQPAKAVDID